MPQPIITFDHVVKEFRRKGSAQAFRAVDDVSLTIDRGEIFCVLQYHTQLIFVFLVEVGFSMLARLVLNS